MRHQITGNVIERHVFEKKIEDGDEVEFITRELICTDKGKKYFITALGKIMLLRDYTFNVMLDFFKKEKGINQTSYFINLY